MKVDLQKLSKWARKQKDAHGKSKSTRRAERELLALEASHRHVLGKRRLVVQGAPKPGKRQGGVKYVDVAALELLNPRRRRVDLEERVRALEENDRVQDVRHDSHEARLDEIEADGFAA